MTAVLLVEREPLCHLLASVLETDLSAVVQCVWTGTPSATAIDTGSFDLAVINVTMQDVSGYELARRAVNRYIPVLLCSGHPDALVCLNQHDIPHLAKPFMIRELIDEAARIIADPAGNIHEVKTALARLAAAAGGLPPDPASGAPSLID